MPTHNHLAGTFVLDVQQGVVPSEALSSNIDEESLVATLKCLEDTTLDLHSQLFGRVKSNVGVFLESRAQNHGMHQQITELVNKIESVDMMQMNVSSWLKNNDMLIAEHQRNRETIDALEALENVLAKLEDTACLLEQKCFLKAADTLCEIEKNFDITIDWEDLPLTQFIAKKLIQLKSDLQQAIEHAFNEALSYKRDQTNVFLDVRQRFPAAPLSSHCVTLQELFKCLSQLQMWPKQMTGLKRTLFDKMLKPIFQHRCFEIRPRKSEYGATLELLATPLNEAQTPEALSILKNINTILQFIVANVFDYMEENIQLKRLFGKYVMPELTKALIESTLIESIPALKEDLDDYDRFAQDVIKWEKLWSDMFDLGSNHEDENDSLTTFVRSIDKQFASKYRERVLTEGRRIITTREGWSRRPVLRPSKIGTDTYMITEMPEHLEKLMKGTLADASDLLKSRPGLSQDLLGTVYDLLDLYQAIIPVFHRPHGAPDQYHTDSLGDECFWLADQLILYNFKCLQTDVARTDIQHYAESLRLLGKMWINKQDLDENDPDAQNNNVMPSFYDDPSSIGQTRTDQTETGQIDKGDEGWTHWDDGDD